MAFLIKKFGEIWVIRLTKPSFIKQAIATSTIPLGIIVTWLLTNFWYLINLDVYFLFFIYFFFTWQASSSTSFIRIGQKRKRQQKKSHYQISVLMLLTPKNSPINWSPSSSCNIIAWQFFYLFLFIINMQIIETIVGITITIITISLRTHLSCSLLNFFNWKLASYTSNF